MNMGERLEEAVRQADEPLADWEIALQREEDERVLEELRLIQQVARDSKVKNDLREELDRMAQEQARSVELIRQAALAAKASAMTMQQYNGDTLEDDVRVNALCTALSMLTGERSWEIRTRLSEDIDHCPGCDRWTPTDKMHLELCHRCMELLS